MLQLMVILALSGVLTDSSNWAVFYPVKNICAVRGFSATLPCNYSYPQRGYKVVQMLWCSMNSNTVKCEKPPYVYNSSSNVTSDFAYGGDDKSNCTLFIQNVKFNYSGLYKFRFITNDDKGKWTGVPGVNLTVSDLKVELIRLSGNGTLKPGDSLNLTCHVNCTHSSSQFVWSKNNQNQNRSGPVLHFPALTVGDSGNYTCTWRTNVSSGSDTISIQVEAAGPQSEPQSEPIWIIICKICGGIFIVFVLVAVIYYRRRKVEAPEENEQHCEQKSQGGDNTCMSELSRDAQTSTDVLNTKEVTYATVCKMTYANVGKKNKNARTRERHTDEQEDDKSTIYSVIQMH